MLDETTAPIVSPLDALANPTSIDEITADGNGFVVQARYGAQALGLQGEDLTVILRFVDDQLAEARYVIVGDGQTGETVTTFNTLSDTTPITSPIG